MTTDFQPGDTVVSKLHKGHKNHNQMLIVRRVTASKNIQVIGKGSRIMTLRQHQLLLVRRVMDK